MCMQKPVQLPIQRSWRHALGPSGCLCLWNTHAKRCAGLHLLCFGHFQKLCPTPGSLPHASQGLLGAAGARRALGPGQWPSVPARFRNWDAGHALLAYDQRLTPDLGLWHQNILKQA